MGFFDFSKKRDDNSPAEEAGKEEQKPAAAPKMDQMMDHMDEMLDNIDTSKMSWKEKGALKLFKKLPRKKKEEALRQMMNPQNIMKEKDKILKQLDEAVKAGQMTKQEADQLKSQLGLR